MAGGATEPEAGGPGSSCSCRQSRSGAGHGDYPDRESNFGFSCVFTNKWHLGSAALDWPPRSHCQAAEREIAEQVACSASSKWGPRGRARAVRPPRRASLLCGPPSPGIDPWPWVSVCVAVSVVTSERGAEMGQPFPALTSSAVPVTRPGCRSRGRTGPYAIVGGVAEAGQ